MNDTIKSSQVAHQVLSYINDSKLIWRMTQPLTHHYDLTGNAQHGHTKRLIQFILAKEDNTTYLSLIVNGIEMKHPLSYYQEIFYPQITNPVAKGLFDKLFSLKEIDYKKHIDKVYLLSDYTPIPVGWHTCPYDISIPSKQELLNGTATHLYY